MLKERHALEELARRLGGAFRAGDAAGAGVHPRVLYALRDEGFLVELSRGVFRIADAEMSPYLDLVAVSRRSPQGAICLNSALSFWDLTDEVPAEVHLAVPRGAHRPRISYPPVRVHVFAAGTFELGRERVRLDSGEEIHVYSPERSVVDAVRLRGRVGTDVAYEALRRYLRRPGASSGELLRLARRLRAGGPMASALEVLTG
ncbi:MAG TPA: type IV toxin-antitoxin system AbiEi family antitoxin domain-containing protein [Rubrobacter sp.]|nr:type IV toxin-antitoxin system AbiEi family antitoxin domain-containing protein [Rubrobacter sp.]